MENLPVHNYSEFSQAVEIKFGIEFPKYTNDTYWIRNFVVAGSGHGKQKISLDIPINLVTGKNTIDLLSVTVGLAVCSLGF